MKSTQKEPCAYHSPQVRDYHSPQVMDYGNVKQITTAVSSNTMGDGGSVSGMRKTA